MESHRFRLRAGSALAEPLPAHGRPSLRCSDYLPLVEVPAVTPVSDFAVVEAWSGR